MKNIDLTTFGDNKADIYLARVLNLPENRHLSKKVGKYLSNINYYFHNINLPNKSLEKNISLKLRNIFIQDTDKITDNILIRDLIKNHISIKFREKLRGIKNEK